MSLVPESYDSRFMKPATMCRCGHILECCADCRHWLLDESPRIARAWSWYVNHVVGMAHEPAGQDLADYAEKADRAYYGL